MANLPPPGDYWTFRSNHRFFHYTYEPDEVEHPCTLHVEWLIDSDGALYLQDYKLEDSSGRRVPIDDNLRMILEASFEEAYSIQGEALDQYHGRS